MHGVLVQPVHLGTGWGVASLLQYSKDNNFYARYTNGNRTNRGIKLSHWNAGNAFLENKVINIENVIADHHPHLIGISEANLHKTHCIDNCKIPNYDIFTSKTLGNKKLQVSRVVVYKHTSLVAKVREDLMCDSFSSIWLEVGLPGKNRILVCNLYRDWQYLGQGDNSSLEIPEQLARWITFLDQWERALESGKECIVMGDFNLDFLTFHRNDLPSSSQAHRLRPLVDELNNKVLPYGIKQCVVGPTRQGRAGQADSGLDHFWTNIPGKISPIVTRYSGSDHKVIMGVRYAKLIRNQPRYVRKRSYKNFDETAFLQRIRETSWWDIYQASEVDHAVSLLTSKIGLVLDEMAPLKTFQTTSKYCPWLTRESKLLIQRRNTAQHKLSENKTVENQEIFRKLRNRATKSIRKDKMGWQKQKLVQSENECQT